MSVPPLTNNQFFEETHRDRTDYAQIKEHSREMNTSVPNIHAIPSAIDAVPGSDGYR